jgi:hypothetical protein
MDDVLHMRSMYWLCAQPLPDASEHGTHLLVSTVPRPVHCPTSTWSGLQEVKLHDEHRVVSLSEVPSQNPVWYCPGRQNAHGTQLVVS